MGFLNPLAFFLLLIIPIIILLHLLKLKRIEKIISSTFLWKKAIDDIYANTPFQKLRKNLLMIIQILIALLLIFAFSRPTIKMRSALAKSSIILIDVSASMKSAQNGETRLDKAKSIALEIVNSLHGDEKIAILSFDTKCNIVSSFTNNKNELRKSIKSIQQNDTPTDIKDALIIATSMAKSVKECEIFILSDGAFKNIETINLKDINVRFIQIGEGSNNVGIIALDTRKIPQIENEYQTFINVLNFSKENKTITLELYQNNTMIDITTQTISPSQNTSHIFTKSFSDEGIIKVVIPEKDDLMTDNVAYSVLKKEEKLKILLLSDGNYFVEKALKSIETVELFLAKPSDYKGTEEYDIVIFDNFSPSTIGKGYYIFINAIPPMEGFNSVGTIDKDYVYDWDRNHPVTQFCSFNDVTVQNSLNMKIPDDVLTIIEGKISPLLTYINRRGINILTFPFDIFNSNLPLNTSFPMLILNIMNWYGSLMGGSEDSVLKTGEVIDFQLTENIKSARLTLPVDTNLDISPNQDGRIIFDKTVLSGLYKFDISSTKAKYFGVNLLNSEESNILPKETLSIGDKKITALKEKIILQKEIWKYFVLIVIILLVIEWLIYHKRILV